MAGFGSAMSAPTEGQAMQPSPEPQSEGEANVTPEEQAMYEQVVGNAMKVIYPDGEGEPTISPQVIDSLKGSEAPVMNLATTAVMLVTSLRDSAKQAGQQIPDDILFHAGVQIVEELADVADASKIYDYSDDDMEKALYLALDMYRTGAEQSGDIDKQGLIEGVEQMKQADQSGTLEQLMPGIKSRMKGAE